MSNLHSHPNVDNMCFHILRERGYDLSVEEASEPPATVANLNPDPLLWRARKNGFGFSAWNAIELLGLTAIFERQRPASFTPGWWVVDGPDIYSELMGQSVPKTDESSTGSNLHSHPSLYNFCLRILHERGYDLTIEGTSEPSDPVPIIYAHSLLQFISQADPNPLLWRARKNDFEFSAYNPIELLGLTAVFEYQKPISDTPDWWYVDGPDIRDELMEKAFPEIDDSSTESVS
jgi:hypothetical protein